ncbi:hypothetical protein CY34DRAFT_808111 [Suillus luteus UH-Slu-Lm8-n1]|uniref:Uncharacterized protein n=1 Tax=Suillus luteus UH-Slu-Lm8-n1 TaxID=930992 RepID=A0A0D0AD20_9AGAM|nr:hypothetical protein CY34DRAFT_808111 [Suillus luteus UH-Slu-Lm8-n1]
MKHESHYETRVSEEKVDLMEKGHQHRAHSETTISHSNASQARPFNPSVNKGYRS